MKIKRYRDGKARVTAFDLRALCVVVRRYAGAAPGGADRYYLLAKIDAIGASMSITAWDRRVAFATLREQLVDLRDDLARVVRR